MRKININKSDNVNLCDINIETKGIIIVYNNETSIGYIIHIDDYWTFSNNIYYEDCIDCNESLEDLIDQINDSGELTFKLLDFE